MARYLIVISLFLVGAAVTSGPQFAEAQTPWPSKPVSMILPIAAGGPGDIVSRKIAAELAEKFGVPFVVENRVGGTGTAGQDHAIRSPPDGYTMFLISISGALAYHFQDRTIDFTKDLTMIGQIYRQAGLIVVNPRIPEMSNIKTLPDLIAYATTNPGKLRYASQGTGSIGHLLMERMRAITGINVLHVPYRGSGPAYTDLLGGHIHLMSSSLAARPYVDAGDLRAIAAATVQRSPLMPDVPTFKEQGVDLVADAWLGYAVPAGTPPDIVKRLAEQLAAAVAKPDIAEFLRKNGTDPGFVPGPEFAERANADFRSWGEVIRVNNIKPN